VFTLLFKSAVSLRNTLYENGVLSVYRPAAPVISVGNISLGGTGKSPLADLIAGRYIARGMKTALVSRGYGRKGRGTAIVSDGNGHVLPAAEGGDEPVLAGRRHPSLVVIADEKRGRGCRIAVERFGTQIIVLDDAFQHRACRRNADIVTIDSTRSPFEDRLLPCGRLREPVGSLARADAIVLAKWDGSGGASALEKRLSEVCSAPMFRTAFAPAALRTLDWRETAPASSLRDLRVFTFCGIADPGSFRRTIGRLGALEAGHKAWPDHHMYTESDVVYMLARADETRAECLVTTGKDAVRLSPYLPRLAERRVCFMEMAVRFESDEELFFKIIDERLTEGGCAA